METKELIQEKYSVNGMTCEGCVATVQEVLENSKEVENVKVQLEYPQATIESTKQLDLEKLNKMLSEKGKYTITTNQEQKLEPLPPVGKVTGQMLPDRSFNTYKPLLLIVSFIAGVSLLVQFPFSTFSVFTWMRHFMAGFFLVFSFFKLLNLSGFANSYRMYDLIAGKWKTWGYIYPFVELGLGIAYLIHFAPFYTNLATVVVLGISSIGVIESNLNKRKIKCACLGDVFNLPMSTVTIVEDLSMVAMAAWMLWV